MDKRIGVKKIKLQQPNISTLLRYITDLPIYNSKNNSPLFYYIPAEIESTFFVDEWDADVSSQEKQKVQWSLVDPVTNKLIIPSFIKGDNVQLTVSKKQSGKTFLLKAATLNQDSSYAAKILFCAVTEPLITSTKWSLTPTGDNINNGNPINYGDNIFLRIDTEGINGEEVYVDVYADQSSGDALAKVYLKYKVINGIIDIYIKDTYSWKSKLKFWTSDIEKFYIKVKLKRTGKYIKDKNGSEKHATYLKIKDKISSEKTTLPSSANLPVKLGQNDINIRQYEPCGYTGITIVKDDKYKNIVLFNEKALRLDKLRIDTEYTYNNIYYAFDKYYLTDASLKVLDNVAAFLMQSPYIPVVLGSHTDSRGTDEYNLKLSQQRSDSAVNYLISKGVSADRIAAKGYGKTKLIVKDQDISTDLAVADKQHQLNRRTTLEFQIYNNNAEAIVYETIVPSSSHPVTMPILISDYNVNECFRQGEDKHKKEVPLERVFPIGDQKSSKEVLPVKGDNTINPTIYSEFSLLNIWPESKNPILYKFNINSCRYYNDKSRNTLIIKAYSDISWKFNFFLNLTNPLGVSWTGLTESQHKEMQSKAGKIGAEERWKQKDASFGFGLEASYDKVGGNYIKKEELKAEFNGRFKKLYDVFSSVSDIKDGIMKKTQGGIRSSRGKGFPLKFELKPPNLSLDGNWALERVTKSKQPTNKIGTQVDIALKANPLLGLELTIDLLAGAVGAVAGALSGGTASTFAVDLVNIIRYYLNEGVKAGDDELGASIKADIYIDLVFSNKITAEISGSFNTQGLAEQTSIKLEGKSTIGAELKAGIYVKAKAALIVVSVEGEFQAKASGKASVSLGGKIYYKGGDGVYLSPIVKFNGLTVEYAVLFKVGVSTKKVPITQGGVELKASDKGTYTLKEDKFTLVEPFDLIETLKDDYQLDTNFKIF